MSLNMTPASDANRSNWIKNYSNILLEMFAIYSSFPLTYFQKYLSSLFHHVYQNVIDWDTCLANLPCYL